MDVSANDVALLHLVMTALDPALEPDVSLVFFVLDRLRGRANRHETFAEFLAQLSRRVSVAAAQRVSEQMLSIGTPEFLHNSISRMY